MDFSSKTAKIWAATEPQIVHELAHVLLDSLDDAFWRASAADKALRALWKRREEQAAKRIEKLVLGALREGARRQQD